MSERVAGASGNAHSLFHSLNMNHLFPYIERTLLHPGVTISEQYTALDDVTQLGLAGLTVAPFWVKKIRRELGNDHPAVLSAVVGYPYGYQRTETKQLETELALKDGATEIEMRTEAKRNSLRPVYHPDSAL